MAVQSSSKTRGLTSTLTCERGASEKHERGAREGCRASRRKGWDDVTKIRFCRRCHVLEPLKEQISLPPFSPRSLLGFGPPAELSWMGTAERRVVGSLGEFSGSLLRL